MSVDVDKQLTDSLLLLQARGVVEKRGDEYALTPEYVLELKKAYENVRESFDTQDDLWAGAIGLSLSRWLQPIDEDTLKPLTRTVYAMIHTYLLKYRTKGAY